MSREGKEIGLDIKPEGPQEETYLAYAIESQVEGFLLGKVLTIIDASYSDQMQREAVKSLIKDKFHSQLDYFLHRIDYANSEDLRKK